MYAYGEDDREMTPTPAPKPVDISALDLPPDRARDKIKTVDELAEIATRARARGRSVVLAHGVFDLVHMGHVRYLEAARAEGDLLMVTVTADQYVNKGPGRPAFPEMLRAEMVAALEGVYWVAVSYAPTAIELIEKIRPDVYVKGSDYKNPEEDVTGNIHRECTAVERHGGRVHFTDDITFSSSNLINNHLSQYDPHVEAYLRTQRRGQVLDRALAAIDGIQNKKVLLVGDAIIDEYQYVGAMGKASKENIIATRFESSELFAGGVFAAANHVANFCAEVEVITVLGHQEPHESLVRDSLHANVNANFVFRRGVPTTRKCRYVDPRSLLKLFEVYHFDDHPLSGREENQLCDLIARRAGEFDLVIVSDFGHGMMTRRAIDLVAETAPFLAVNAQSNAANQGFNPITKYPRADYVCIDEPEVRFAMHNRFTELGELIETGLAQSIDCDKMIVTHGRQGCVTYSPGEGITDIPAFAGKVVDTMGAGDAFLSVTSPIVAHGTPMELSGFIGNCVGALKVGIVGHRKSVEKTALVKFITALLK